MDKLKKSLIVITIVVALGLVIISVTSSTSQGQGGGNQPLFNVNVINPAAAPVPVRDVSVPVPFQRTLTTDLSDGDGGPSFTIDVPEGKLAAIEHVSFGARLPIGQVARAHLTCQGGAPTTGHVNFAIPFESQGVFDSGSLGPMSTLVANSPVRCYADGDSSVLGEVTRNSTTGETGEISFSVSGHLIDHP